MQQLFNNVQIFLILAFHYFCPVFSALLDGEKFDYVVVGGGSAGCVVAARLAEAGNTVLLIHEGGFPPAYLNIPAITLSHLFGGDSSVDKSYPSLPLNHAAQAYGGVFNFRIGKVLGGSGSHNEMYFNRGSPHDFDHWAEVGGDPSWKYENMLEYFRKLETYEGVNPTDQRGAHGPIAITNPTYTREMWRWLQAGRELGYKVADPNAPQQESFAWIDFSKRKGRRSSSFNEYILPLLKTGQASAHNPLTPEFPIPLNSNLDSIKEPGHLTVLIETIGKQIIFDKEGPHPKAIGVKLSSAIATNLNLTGQVYARKEVIISAGVMDSPALLMRSGIGPPELLKNCGIPQVAPLPVGQGLQDHAYVWFPIIYGKGALVFNPDKELTPEAWQELEQTGDGPFSFSGAGGQSFLVSEALPDSERELGWPDIHVVPANQNFTNRADPQQSDLKEWEVAVLWGTAVSRPRSRGKVALNCEDIDGPPLIDFNLLSEEQDRQVLIDAIKKNIRICEGTKAFQEIGCRVPNLPHPFCENIEYRTGPYWECVIKATAAFGNHAAGTCPMGKGPEAVVDSRLRVIGVAGLRVVDASVMPTIVNANVQGPVLAIAEKAVDMILEDNK